MGASALAQVLRPLETVFPHGSSPDLLVGLDAPDDAAVYRLSDDDAIVVTTDFFPPVVDDPYDYGSIAAANAMSDVFAMGAEVLLALNLAGFPEVLPPEIAAEVIRGGAEKVAEAGAVLAGGHTITGPEPLYGLAVVGRVHPDRVMRKGGAVPGDAVVLTKPLGSGVVTTALKQGRVSADHLAAAVSSMKSLNRVAGRVAADVGAHAVTDITGFGLIGHSLELADSSGTAVCLEIDSLPLLPGARHYAESGCVPGGTITNGHTYAPRVEGLDALPKWWLDLLFDPQTSGGLLVALPTERAGAYVRSLAEQGIEARRVGAVEPGAGVRIVTQARA
jgi:selenide,water dikinase